MNAPLATVGTGSFRAAVEPNWATTHAAESLTAAIEQLENAAWALDCAGFDVEARQDLRDAIRDVCITRRIVRGA